MVRRWALWLVALSLVATACGHGKHVGLGRGPGGSTTTVTLDTIAGETTTTGAAGAPTTAGAPTGTAASRAPTRGGGTTPRATNPPAPAPAACPNVDAVHIKLTQIGSFNQPLALAYTPDGALFVAEKGGAVKRLDNGQTILDVSGVSGFKSSGEQGLIGLAIAPDGRHLYVNYTAGNVGDTHTVEYPFDGHAVGARREIFTQTQPYANHNGGNLVFGPDGMLWAGLGDGGSEDDPQNNAQNDNTFLGKMVIIDPGSGTAHIRSKGLRNPFRYSFDRANGDLWIGDVGGSEWEEVDFRAANSPPGENYGWRTMEGNHQHIGTPAPGAIPPIYEYKHAPNSSAVTGGYVYRGTRIPNFNGVYVFSDFYAGQLTGLVQCGGRLVGSKALGANASQVSSFGEDKTGELYVLSLAGPVYRIDPA